MLHTDTNLPLQKSKSADSLYQANLDSYLDNDLNAYYFDLPQHLIATNPILPKEDARLLVYRNGIITHTTFRYLFDFIPRDYLIVLNNTKVIKARFFATKLLQDNKHLSPHQREFFYHKALGDNKHLVQIRGKVKLHDYFMLSKESNIFLQVTHIADNGFKEIVFFSLPYIESNLRIESTLQHIATLPKQYLSDSSVLEILERYGHIPLPPYIKRESNKVDEREYQSIFAYYQGSVAAPTASLHFSESMLQYLLTHYKSAFVTLHVGAGTFKPITATNIMEHKIHSEYCKIPIESLQMIQESKKILCVGTTAMRTIEWFAHTHKTEGENDIFLNPFNPPQKVQALLTNFHLPKSSLIVLVSSMIGRKETLRIYHEAIQKSYRFYSYGDGMLII